MDYQIINLVLHILIVLLLVWTIFSKSETLKTAQGGFLGDFLSGYVGGGLNSRVYTSGATMRRLGQLFSSANQGQSIAIHNIDGQEVLYATAIPTEHMQTAQGGKIPSGYVGSGVINHVYTSGATMRRLGQIFTSTNQDQGTPVSVELYDIENANAPPLKLSIQRPN